jgi:hypothetical protein
MATYNFYFRTIIKDETSEYWKIDYPDTVTPTHAVCREVFNNTQELFVLYPKISFTNPSDNISVVPTLFNKNLYEFRLGSGVYSTTYPYERNFGSVDSLIPEAIDLRLKFIHLTEKTSTDTEPTIDCSNTLGWGDIGWTITNQSNFRSQIANFIAKCCDNSRLKTDIQTEPISTLSDFVVYIFPQASTVNISDYTFVVFYPGNDAAYQQLITVDT